MADEKDITLEANFQKLLVKREGILKNLVDLEIERSRKFDEYVTKQERSMRLAEKRADIAEDLLEYAKMDKEDRQREEADLANKIQRLREAGEAKKAELDVALELSALQQQIATGEQEEVARAIKKLEATKELLELRQDIKDVLDEEVDSLKRSTAELTRFFGIGASFNQTILGNMVKGFSSLSMIIANSEKDFEKMAIAASEGFADAGLGFLVARAEEVMSAQDAMIANFRKQTTASDETASAVLAASNELMQLGLNFESAGEAGAALYNTTTAFRTATRETQIQTASFVGQLVELGISADTVADNMQLMTMGMGMTLEEAALTTDELRKFANSIDVNINQAMEDFGKHMEELVAHGSSATEVFKGLQVQARLTGISMDGLMRVAGQFDTFTGAAEAVGKLNGILGGSYLNSIDMVYATEEERLELMHQSLALSGRSFNELSRYEKKALSAAAGFESVGEAQRFFNSQLDDPAAIEASERQETLADQARDMKPIFERLQMAMNKFALSMEPVINAVISLVEGIASLGKGNLAFIMGTVASFAVFVKLIGFYRKMKALMDLTRQKRQQDMVLQAQETAVKQQDMVVTNQQIATEQRKAAAKQLTLGLTTGNTTAQVAETAANTADSAGNVVQTGTEASLARAKGTNIAAQGALMAGPFAPFVFAGILAVVMGLISKSLAGGFKDGTDFAPGGLSALAEDGKTEMVMGRRGSAFVTSPTIANLDRGDKVISNANLKNAGGGAAVVASGPSVESMKAAFKAALKEHETDQRAKTPAKQAPLEVSLKINERVFAKEVVKVVEDKGSLKLTV